MQITNSLRLVQYAAAISALRAANQQPELALQLIEQAAAAGQAVIDSAQSPPATVPQAEDTPQAVSAATGQAIDIMA